MLLQIAAKSRSILLSGKLTTCKVKNLIGGYKIIFFPMLFFYMLSMPLKVIFLMQKQ